MQPRAPSGEPRAPAGTPVPGSEAATIVAALEVEGELLRTITENAATALFMMDTDGYPIFMNRAARDMTGYSGVEEIAARPLHYAVHFKRPDGSPYPMEECPIDRANAEIRPLRDQDEVWCRKDGTLFPVRYNVAPIERDGTRLGAVIEVRDVTHERMQERKLHALFMQAPAAIAMVDGPEHVFSFVNARYRALVGKQANELLGVPAAEALPALREQGFIALLDKVRATGEPFEAQAAPVVLPHADGPRLSYHHFTYHPVRSPGGEVESILGVAIDVTPQVEAQHQTRALAEELDHRVRDRTRELTSANVALREANAALESFASVVSHDLKEPVRAIEAYLSAAEEAPTEAERVELLRMAIEANRRQSALIQGLLAYSRATLTPADAHPVDLTEVVRQSCLSYYEHLAAERGASVDVEPLPRVLGNDVVLTQLFGNLVLNAVRHGGPRASVRVHARPESRPDDLVEILVDDTGPGFPQEVRDLLARIDAGRAATTVRGGFGLAIAHRAAQRLGGRLALDATERRGGRVRVLLPRA